jgi:hypothetical protein
LCKDSNNSAFLVTFRPFITFFTQIIPDFWWFNEYFLSLQRLFTQNVYKRTKL